MTARTCKKHEWVHKIIKHRSFVNKNKDPARVGVPAWSRRETSVPLAVFPNRSRARMDMVFAVPAVTELSKPSVISDVEADTAEGTARSGIAVKTLDPRIVDTLIK